MVVGRPLSYWVLVTFQGRTVKLGVDGKNTGKMDGEFPWRFVCVPVPSTRFVKKVDSSFLQGHLLISISKLIRFY